MYGGGGGSVESSGLLLGAVSSEEAAAGHCVDRVIAVLNRISPYGADMVVFYANRQLRGPSLER